MSPASGVQFGAVKPFFLKSADQFALPGPLAITSTECAKEINEVRELGSADSTKRTAAQTAVAIFWTDSPTHIYGEVAQAASKEHKLSVADNARLFAMMQMAIAEGSIASWSAKYKYNVMRPITAIRTLFRGQAVRAWAGPYQGTKMIDGSAWFPYQPMTFPTPPFPEYSSGHSNFSAAGAEILKLFTGSDRFGGSTVVRAGSSRIEPGAVPSDDVTLSWATFSDAANQAGLSRRYGGIHFERGDIDARATGRLAARIAWNKAQQYWQGD